jgi:hypothetical protein
MVAKLTDLGFSAAMAATVVGRSERSVSCIRTDHKLKRPLRPHLLPVHITAQCHAVLVDAAAHHKLGVARVAAITLECAAARQVHLLENVVLPPPPPRASAPLSSLFSPALEARL